MTPASRPLSAYPGYAFREDGSITAADGSTVAQTVRRAGEARVRLSVWCPSVSARVCRRVDVSRLICEAWHGPANGHVRHLNGVVGDNRAANLAWGARVCRRTIQAVDASSSGSVTRLPRVWRFDRGEDVFGSTPSAMFETPEGAAAAHAAEGVTRAGIEAAAAHYTSQRHRGYAWRILDDADHALEVEAANSGSAVVETDADLVGERWQRLPPPASSSAASDLEISSLGRARRGGCILRRVDARSRFRPYPSVAQRFSMRSLMLRAGLL